MNSSSCSYCCVADRSSLGSVGSVSGGRVGGRINGLSDA